jgi:hypothetical protein
MLADQMEGIYFCVLNPLTRQWVILLVLIERCNSAKLFNANLSAQMQQTVRRRLLRAYGLVKTIGKA